MNIPKDTIVAVADGENLILFRNTGDDTTPSLQVLPAAAVSTENVSAGMYHHDTAKDHDSRQLDEFAFAAGIVETLNSRVLAHKIENLVVIAAPRTLGEMRRHYHKTLKAVLIGEMDKDLTGHSTADIEKAIMAA